MEVASVEPMMSWCGTPSGLSLLKFVSISDLIVLTTLLWVREAGHSGVYFLKCFVRFRRCVFIWVHPKALLLVSTLQIIVVHISRHSKHSVVVFTAENIPSQLLLLGCEWFLLRLRDRGSLWCRW